MMGINPHLLALPLTWSLATAASVKAAAPLVCEVNGALRSVSAGGDVGEPIRPAQPIPFTHLGAAGATLIGVGEGQIYRARGGAWRTLGAVTGDSNATQSDPLRITSGVKDAVIWLRGTDPGTVAGAVLVPPRGAVKRLDFKAARALGPIWRVQAAAAGESICPEVVRDWVSREARSAGACALLFNEPAPWGGRLVAPQLGEEGDWPSGPLLHLKNGILTPLRHRGHALDYRGAAAWLPDGALLFDGRYSAAREGVLLVRGERMVTTLQGVEGPCAVVGGR